MAADSDDRELTDADVDDLLRQAGVDVDKSAEAVLLDLRERMRRVHRDLRMRHDLADLRVARQELFDKTHTRSDVDDAVGAALGRVVQALRYRNLDHCVEVVEQVAADLGVPIRDA